MKKGMRMLSHDSLNHLLPVPGNPGEKQPGDPQRLEKT